MISPRLRHYLTLFEGFVSARTTADEFERQFLELHRNGFEFYGPEIDQILIEVFSAVDSYCGDEALRDEDDLDSDELRSEISNALARLRSFLPD